jgi:mRNA interferase MazF
LRSAAADSLYKPIKWLSITNQNRPKQNAENGKAVTSLSTSPPTPKRGEIWLVSFDPTIGAEIKKTRPAIVISSDAVGRLPIKLVAPLTDWKDYYAANIWHVRIDPDATNGLSKVSAVDTLQLRGMDRQRFVRKLGQVTPTQLEEMVLAVAAVIEYP